MCGGEMPTHLSEKLNYDYTLFQEAQAQKAQYAGKCVNDATFFPELCCAYCRVGASV